MSLNLYGIIPPLVTPFNEDESINEAALRAEVRFHIDLGVPGICVTGSSGDGQMLSLEDAVQVAHIAVEETAGAVPVIAGIIQDSTIQVVRYGKALKEVGVDAIQVTPVHYLFHPDEDATVEYYRRITEETELPVLIYNVIPYALIPASTVIRVLNELPNVIAVKQSGGNIHELADLLGSGLTKNRIFTAIDDLLYPSYLLGAAGGISATLTVVPQLCLDQWNAVQNGDHEAALALHNRLLPIWRSLDGPNMTVRMRYAIKLQGRDGGFARSPLTPLTQAEKDGIRAGLIAGGVEIKEAALG